MSTTASAQETGVAPAGNSGLALEMQGRLSILSDFGVGQNSPRFLPPVAIGLRLLEGRLFVGLGLVYDSVRAKACGGGTCVTNRDGHLFGVAPVVTYDILSRGAAHLYPMATLTFARTDLFLEDDDFAWGANLGLGIRGDLGDAISIGSEWGWGFLRSGHDYGGGGTGSIMAHGFWGTITMSARIGL